MFDGRFDAVVDRAAYGSNDGAADAQVHWTILLVDGEAAVTRPVEEVRFNSLILPSDDVPEHHAAAVARRPEMAAVEVSGRKSWRRRLPGGAGPADPSAPETDS